MSAVYKKKEYQICEGVPVPLGFNVDAFRSAVHYKPIPGDLIITTYPKCGTTWMHHIVLLILRKGKVSKNPMDFFLGCPFLEMTGADALDIKPRPGAMKTHLPFHAIPYSTSAKYIYIARNPKDCCVSFYHHMMLLKMEDVQYESFDEFFEDFVRGELAYGDYFDHLLEWYKHRDDKNVYFSTYENLRTNTKEEIIKISKFIGDEYEKMLKEDPQVLEDILHYSSFEYMRKDANDAVLNLMDGEVSVENQDLPSGLKAIIERMQSKQKEKGSSARGSGNFVRKGIIGDWKNHFNPDQVRRLEERIVEKNASDVVEELWKDI